jgi:hypothetical protein
VKQSAHDHPKLRTLARILGIPQYAADGVFDRLIRVTSKYAPRGDIGKWTDEQIAAALDWNDSPEVVIAALVESGLMDPSEDGRVIVHDWPDHCEDSVHNQLARKALFFADGSKPKLNRLGKKERERIEADYTRIENARHTHGVRTQNAMPKPAPEPKPMPMPMPMPMPVPSKETSCGETDADPDSETSDPCVLEFPCDGPVKTWQLRQSLFDELSRDFPSLNVLEQARSSLAWLKADPARRKTAKGMRRFLTGWLSKSQNSGQARAGPAQYAASRPELDPTLFQPSDER